MFDANVVEQEWNAFRRFLNVPFHAAPCVILEPKITIEYFLALTENLHANGFSAAALARQLLTLTGESGEWPDEI